MSTKSFTLFPPAPEDVNIWVNLKHAIATSSGFQRWRSELALDVVEQTPLDQLVRRYLRETLETLAY